MKHIIIFITPAQVDELKQLTKAVQVAKADVEKVENTIRFYRGQLAKADGSAASIEEQATALGDELRQFTLALNYAEGGKYNPAPNEAQIDEYLAGLRQKLTGHDGLRHGYYATTLDQVWTRKEIKMYQDTYLAPAKRKLAEAEAAYRSFITGLLA